MTSEIADGSGVELKPIRIFICSSGDMIEERQAALPPHSGEALEPVGRHNILGPVNMRPGDRVEVEITGLGVLANAVIGDEKASYRPR